MFKNMQTKRSLGGHSSYGGRSGNKEDGYGIKVRASILLLFVLLCRTVVCQTLTPPEIQTILRTNPPSAGDETQRENAILDLDEYLKDDSARTDPDIIALYENMMGFVESEINQSVPTGARLWSTYNHGFIVKTSDTVFAFDLVDAYDGWSYRIPDAVLEQIQVLFVSHRHDDHLDPNVISSIVGFGGDVIAPSEEDFGTIGLSPNEEVTVAGLHVKAYDGFHGVPLRIYKVTTPEGVTIMHTGDNWSSETLPDGETVDILLLNAWVNESGTASAIVGMRNCITKLTPLVTIPGHIQELRHDYDPLSTATRVPFEWPLAVDDVSVPGQVSVQVWGEHYDFAVEPIDADGDGLRDEDETRDLDPGTEGVQNPFDPEDPDSTGDDGDPNPDGVPDGLNDWDGDGVNNRTEFAFGYNPTDAESVPALPLTSALGTLAIAALLAGTGLAVAARGRHAKRRQQ